MTKTEIAGFVVAVFLVGCGTDRFYGLARHVNENCGKRSICQLKLSDVYRGNWEFAYYFPSGATLPGIEKTVGAKVNFEFDEICSHFVFVKGGKVIDHDVDCSASGESDWHFLRQGRSVYRTAVIQVDRGDEAFLKIPFEASAMTFVNIGADSEGRVIYVASRKQ